MKEVHPWKIAREIASEAHDSDRGRRDEPPDRGGEGAPTAVPAPSSDRASGARRIWQRGERNSRRRQQHNSSTGRRARESGDSGYGSSSGRSSGRQAGDSKSSDRNRGRWIADSSDDSSSDVISRDETTHQKGPRGCAALFVYDRGEFHSCPRSPFNRPPRPTWTRSSRCSPRTTFRSRAWMIIGRPSWWRATARTWSPAAAPRRISSLR